MASIHEIKNGNKSHDTATLNMVLYSGITSLKILRENVTIFENPLLKTRVVRFLSQKETFFQIKKALNVFKIKIRFWRKNALHSGQKKLCPPQPFIS